MNVKRTTRKTLATILAACMLTSGMATGVSAYYEDDESFDPNNHTFGIIGGFTEWSYDIPMSDDNGDGIYVGSVDCSDWYNGYEYEFKIRADGSWDCNWGEYEEDYDRTLNSQTNFRITKESEDVFYVYLDTTGEYMNTWDCGWTYDPSEIKGEPQGEVFTTEDGFSYTKTDTEVQIVSYNGESTTIVIPDTIENLPVTKIKNSTFSKSVKSVTLPSSFKNIPANMFSGCSNLEEVVLPKGLLTIGDSAFSNCSNLKSLTIPESVTSVGSRCFSNSGLQSIEILGKIQSLPEYAFNNCESLTTVKLPQTLTEIGYQAFGNCKALDTIVIPDSVESIASYAFSGCSGLKNITLPSELTSIESNTFSYTGLESIVIPDSVEYISSYAFESCESLKSVTIGSMVSSINSYAFQGCTALEEFNVSSDNAYYASVDGALFNRSKTTLITYPVGKQDESFTIPNTVSTISENAFRNAKLTSVAFPSSVTDINENAFADSKIKSVTLPSSLTYVGDYAFAGCQDLESVKMGKNMTSIPYGCFNGCSSLKEVTFGKNVKTIGSYAFANCNSLTEINIPEGITKIGYEAFAFCKNLASVTFPSTLTQIEGEAFYSCSSLSSVEFPEGLTRISYEAFAYCGKLASVTFPSTLTQIDREAFYECDSLESVELPAGITSMGYEVFGYCNNLKTIVANCNVPSRSVFYECNSIESVTLGDKVTDFVASTFNMNSNTKLIVSSGNQSFSVDDDILYNKDKTVLIYRLLSNTSVDVTIPDTVTEIGESAFYNSSIETVTIPKSVTKIGSSAFSNCQSLKTVTMDAVLTEIPYSAFNYCTSLESITIPDTVTEIGSYAFYNCQGLKKVVIPDATITIGENSFENCDSLETVILGNNVQNINYEAFEYCYNLKSVIIPESCTYIGYDAFYSTNSYFTIYGKAGSYAETYALDNNKTFEEYNELENFSLVTNTAVKQGDTVNIRGLADGGIGRYQYECDYKAESDKKWTSIQTFAKNNRLSFTAAKSGLYNIRIKVRDDLNTVVTKELQVKVSNSITNTSKISAEEVKVGTEVKITGGASGGTAPYTYSYYFKRSENTSWKAIKENTTAATASLTPTAASSYDVKVIVKDSSGTTAEKTFTVKAKAENELLNTSVVNSDTVQVGDKVRVSASANGGSGSYTYAYYYKRSTNNTWKTLGTEFGTTSSVSFTPTAEADFDVKVIVKDSSGATAEKFFTIKAVNEMELTNVSVVSRTEVKVGTAIPITGKAVGGTSPFTYAFYFKRSTNSTWKVLGEKFGTATTARLKPTAAATYDIKVVVKDSTGKTAEKTFKAVVK